MFRFRRGIFGLGFLALLFVGLLSLGAMRFAGQSRGGDQVAYSAGYEAGLAAAGLTEEGAAPAAPASGRYDGYYGPSRYSHSWGFGLFGGLMGGFFRFIFFFLLIGLFLRLFGFGRWGHGRRWGHGPGGHHGHGPHGHGPHDHGPGSEKGPEDVDPMINRA